MDTVFQLVYLERPNNKEICYKMNNIYRKDTFKNRPAFPSKSFIPYCLLLALPENNYQKISPLTFLNLKPGFY